MFDWLFKKPNGITVVQSTRVTYKNDYPHMDLSSLCYSLVDWFEENDLFHQSSQSISGVNITIHRGWPPYLTLINGDTWSVYYGDDGSYRAHIESEDQFLSDLRVISEKLPQSIR